MTLAFMSTLGRHCCATVARLLGVVEEPSLADRQSSRQRIVWSRLLFKKWAICEFWRSNSLGASWVETFRVAFPELSCDSVNTTPPVMLIASWLKTATIALMRPLILKWKVWNDGCWLVIMSNSFCYSAETMIHPDRTAKKSRENDLAVIILKRAPPYTDFIRPICLSDSTIYATDQAFYVAGWGWTNGCMCSDPFNYRSAISSLPLFSVKSSAATVKQHAKIKKVDADRCRQEYPELNLSADSQLCAGGNEGVNVSLNTKLWSNCILNHSISALSRW